MNRFRVLVALRLGGASRFDGMREMTVTEGSQESSDRIRLIVTRCSFSILK